MDLNQVLQTAQQVLKDLTTLQNETAAVKAELDRQLASLKPREERVAGIESAQVVLSQVQAIKDQNEKDRLAVIEDRVVFDNYARQVRVSLDKERADLAPLKDLQIQIQQDRQALEKEKLEYRARIKKELIEHFKNTQG